MSKNTYTRSSSWKRRSPDGKQQSQGSQRSENPYQDKKSGKLFGICKLLSTLYQEF